MTHHERTTAMLEASHAFTVFLDAFAESEEDVRRGERLVDKTCDENVKLHEQNERLRSLVSKMMGHVYRDERYTLEEWEEIEGMACELGVTDE